ncbi:glycosyltransferase [Alteromonas antoniana]|uniref:glycosyltransferase n=1 Tax=Alteromonas antoniana TaxID=2803813 RepID=UPI001C437A4A|nr:glycosyltransferase [Alteromonas antoniana]
MVSSSNGPIKILHLTYDMRIGGTEMVIKNIIYGLHSSECSMSIYCIEAPLGPWGEALKQSGVSIETTSRLAGFDRNLIMQVRNHIKQHQIDIIHCHQYTPWVYGTLAAAGTRTKVIFTEHGRFYPDSSSWKRRIVNPILLKLTDSVTTISKATKHALEEFEYIPESSTKVIYNGINPLHVDNKSVESLKQGLVDNTDTKVIGTIARLDPIKNQTMMLHAFSRVLNHHSNTKLLIVGDGEERARLESTVKELKISTNVIFTGYITDPSEYLAIMDIFLLSSLSEGTSMTLLEAMSLSKPCVVTDAGGNAEIIEHGVNGLVTPNNDIEAFAKAISSFLSTDLSAMKKAAKERFEQLFTADKMADSYQAIYKQVLSQK